MTFLRNYRESTLAHICIMGALLLLVTTMQAQTFTVLHTFTGGADGGNPRAGLTGNGNIMYGTAFSGGGYENGGVVFNLKHAAGGWTLNPLYSSADSPDAVAVGPSGALYATGYHGGTNNNGTVFELQPPATICHSISCPWSERNLYRFTGNPDGSVPNGGVVFDQAGNLYGATQYGGGPDNPGTIYELKYSNGTWTEDQLYRFTGGSDGSYLNSVIFGPDGNLYGTALYGGLNNNGTVFELQNTGAGWMLKVLHTFQGGLDGFNPTGGVIFDRGGNIYGTTAAGGPGGAGIVFEMTPSGGDWTISTLFGFSGLDECGPYASLSMDQGGNLYGTTYCTGAYQYGTVFKLAPSGSGWTHTILHQFTGASDGAYTFSNVRFDANGNLYGTALLGGMSNNNGCVSTCGVVWEITHKQ
jgi:uncharacterized repeat protein (TIGR03803 family)